MPNYFPSKESEKREWYLSLKENLPVVAQQINLDPQTSRDWDTKTAIFISHIDNVSQKERELEQAQRERDEYREQEMPSLHQTVNHWKTHPNYTRSSGERAGIEKAANVKSAKILTSSKNLKVSVVADVQKVNISFKKAKNTPIAIYCKRGSETEFSLLRFVLNNEYQDNRLNLNNSSSERREYCFSIIKDDKELDRSSIYMVAVAQQV
jgi:hypothetical protein